MKGSRDELIDVIEGIIKEQHSYTSARAFALDISDAIIDSGWVNAVADRNAEAGYNQAMEFYGNN